MALKRAIPIRALFCVIVNNTEFRKNIFYISAAGICQGVAYPDRRRSRRERSAEQDPGANERSVQRGRHLPRHSSGEVYLGVLRQKQEVSKHRANQTDRFLREVCETVLQCGRQGVSGDGSSLVESLRPIVHGRLPGERGRWTASSVQQSTGGNVAGFGDESIETRRTGLVRVRS